MDSVADKMYEQEKQIFGDAVKKLPNNHKTRYFLIGSFGNYSFEVINETLKQRNFAMLPIQSFISEVDDPKCIGIIVNIQQFAFVPVSKVQAEPWYHALLHPLQFFSNKAPVANTGKEEYVKKTVYGHWFAIGKQQGHTWYNLDSKLPVPEELGTSQKVYDFLNTLSKTQDTTVQYWKICLCT